MAFTEFYCNAATGSNLNAGSTEDAAAYTATNGGWNATTGVFTPASGDPSASVSVGMFASIYADAATVTGFVGRVTAVDSTTITVSLTAKSGTAPGTSATGISCKVGGVWKGPNAAVNFPFGFVAATLTDSSDNTPRVNLKNSATYTVSAGVGHAIAGPCRFQGYSATVGDGGKCTIDGSGGAYTVLGFNAADLALVDAIVCNNGTSGNQRALLLNSSCARNYLARVVCHTSRSWGFNIYGSANVLEECEAYNCNTSNMAGGGGFIIAGTAELTRCVSHDNSGSNSVGFSAAAAGTVFEHCVAAANGSDGFACGMASSFRSCDAYLNGGDGIDLSNTAAAVFVIENCNLIANGGWGINGSGSGPRTGALTNCGFGAGTAANTSGTTTGLKSMAEFGSVTYAANVTPWVDPANGDFRVNLAASAGAGRGAFTQTASGYAGTVAYPDIGAAQHAELTAAAIAAAMWGDTYSPVRETTS